MVYFKNQKIIIDDIDYYRKLSQKVLTLIFNINIITKKIDSSNKN